MKPLSSLLKPRQRPKTGPRSERAELVGYFTDSVNKEREGTKWPQVSPRYIAVKLAHLSVFDLHYLKKTLEDYTARGNSFSRGFFGSLKIKDE